MVKAIHMMLRVRDEQRSIRFYDEVFGLQIADRFDFDRFSLIYLRNAESDFELELTVNRGPTEPYELGTGYGHLAFVVDDLAGERERIVARGHDVGPIKELQHDGAMLARYCFLADPDGYKIEILERHGRYR